MLLLKKPRLNAGLFLFGSGFNFEIATLSLVSDKVGAHETTKGGLLRSHSPSVALRAPPPSRREAIEIAKACARNDLRGVGLNGDCHACARNDGWDGGLQ